MVVDLACHCGSSSSAVAGPVAAEPEPALAPVVGSFVEDRLGFDASFPATGLILLQPEICTTPRTFISVILFNHPDCIPYLVIVGRCPSRT